MYHVPATRDEVRVQEAWAPGVRVVARSKPPPPACGVRSKEKPVSLEAVSASASTVSGPEAGPGTGVAGLTQATTVSAPLVSDPDVPARGVVTRVELPLKLRAPSAAESQPRGPGTSS